MALSSSSALRKVWWARWCRLRSRQVVSMAFSSGACRGSHSTVSQAERAASAAWLALLVPRKSCGFRVDGAVVENKDDGLSGLPGLRAVAAVQQAKQGGEVAAALGGGRVHQRLAREGVQHAEQGHLARLAQPQTLRVSARRLHAQVCTPLRPGMGEVGSAFRAAKAPGVSASLSSPNSKAMSPASACARRSCSVSVRLEPRSGLVEADG